MFGWMILFALMALIGTILTLVGHPPETAVRMASVVFAFLFVLTLVTRAVRGRA
jgi:hypothetical protein